MKSPISKEEAMRRLSNPANPSKDYQPSQEFLKKLSFEEQVSPLLPIFAALDQSSQQDTLDELLKDLDPDAPVGKTYAQLAADYPESRGLQQLAQAERDGSLLCTMAIPSSCKPDTSSSNDL